MLRKGQASHMTLDRAGFTLHEPTGYTRFLWRDVSRFEKLEPHRVNSIIVFDDLTREPGALGVGNTSLVENYGLSPLALMDLMNEWRERALIGFSSEVGTGSRLENPSNKKAISGAPRDYAGSAGTPPARRTDSRTTTAR